jgi:hypothetical protein
MTEKELYKALGKDTGRYFNLSFNEFTNILKTELRNRLIHNIIDKNLFFIESNFLCIHRNNDFFVLENTQRKIIKINYVQTGNLELERFTEGDLVALLLDKITVQYLFSYGISESYFLLREKENLESNARYEKKLKLENRIAELKAEMCDLESELERVEFVSKSYTPYSAP